MKPFFTRIDPWFGPLLLVSLYIGVMKSTLDFALSLESFSALSLVPFFFALLFLGQILCLRKKNKLAWIFSTIQVMSIYFFSISTFGYIFSHVLHGLSFYPAVFSYLIALLTIASEIVKTVYLYQKLQ